MTVTVWSNENCIQCDMTKKQMEKRGIRFEAESLQANPKQLEQFIEAGFTQAPIVVTPNKTWAGFKLGKIEDLAHEIFSQKRAS